MSRSSAIAARVVPSLPHPSLARYAVDRGNRCLWRDRERLELAPKAFDVLDYLRRNPGRVLSQDDILDEVWPNRFVQPEIVKTYIRTLRRLLEDDARRPRFIETRPRSGYRFLGELPDWQGAQPPSISCLLLGRGNECAAIKAALDKARAGRRECIVITGEAGLGRSALLDAAAAGARLEPDVVVATSYGVPTRRLPEPLGLSIALLQDVARQFEPSVLAAAVAAHAAHWARYLAPQPGIILDRPQPSWWPQQMAREACALIEHLATHSIILLAVDDLQWADPDTSDLLVSLASRRYPARLLIVTTFRRIEFSASCPIGAAVHGLIRQGRAQELALPPLDDSECIAMLQQCSDQAAECREVAMECGGNPRLLQTLVALANSASRDAVRASALANPMLQVDDIPPDVQRVLEAGSIAGPRFCAWAVAKVLGMEQDPIDELLSRLASSRQYLRLDGSYGLPDGTSTPIYTFRHPVHHRLLLEHQPPRRRSERFRKFGEAIVTLWGENVKDVANDVSNCFRSAGDWPGAIAYSQLAAKRATEKDCLVDAARFLTQALDLSARLPLAQQLAAQRPIRDRLRGLGAIPVQRHREPARGRPAVVP